MKIRNYTITEIKNFLGGLGIFLIAFDAFPFFIGGSIYRPISIFPFLIYFILLFYQDFLNGRVKKNNAKLLFLFGILLVVSSLKGFEYSDFEGTIDFFITGTLGYVSFVSLDDFFSRLKSESISADVFFDRVAFLYLKAMCIPCFFGIIQIFIVLFHIRHPILSKLFSMVTYRFTLDRIFLVCGEPSWAVLYLIVLLYFIIFTSSLKYRKMLGVMSFVLILFTFSMLGYMSLVIALVIYYLFYLVKNPGKISQLFIMVFLVLFILVILDKLLGNDESSSYLAIRYRQIKELFLFILEPKLLYTYIQITDSSIFLRFVNPIIGIMICLQNLWLGVGGGFYYIYYPDFIFKYFPLAVQLDEVSGAAYNLYHTTSKNLFCRFYAEFGFFVGSIIFIKFLLKLTRISRNDKRGLFLLTLVFTVVFNFDSLCYILFLFLLSFFEVYSRREEDD